MPGSPSYSETLAFVTDQFQGVTDKAGVPYWTHCQRVAERLMDPTEDERLAALLHDVVEDTAITLEDLRARGYAPAVVEIVRLVTRDRSLEYLDWVRTIIASGNRSAMKVKLADNQDNADPERVRLLPPDKQATVQRYHRSIDLLRAALGSDELQ